MGETNEEGELPRGRGSAMGSETMQITFCLPDFPWVGPQFWQVFAPDRGGGCGDSSPRRQ